jgi:hypothetical protein
LPLKLRISGNLFLPQGVSISMKKGALMHRAGLCALLLAVSIPIHASGMAKKGAARSESTGTQAGRTEGAKIISQYVRAAGGARALSRIQTLSLEGTATTSGETNSGTYTFDTKVPNRYYSELLVGGKRFIEAYNGKSAWHEDASATPATLVSPESTELETEAEIANTRLLNLKKNKLAVAFLGHAQVNGKDALAVEVASASGAKRDFYFDPQSHLLVKEGGSIRSAAQEILYSDYRPAAGVEVPRKLELHFGPQTYAIAITRVAINDPIGERVFDLPLSSQVKLPDLQALFKEIDENQKAIDKIKEDYAGTEVEEEIDSDADGKVKKRTVTESSFFYFDGEEISTVTKRDGKPLSDAEEKKQIENAQKRVAEIQKRKAKEDAQEEKAKEEGKKEKDDDDVGIEMFLRAGQFVNPRRERFRGQDVLVFDFEANPEYKPRNLAERIVQKLAGSIWVDEKAHDVVRLEAYFTGNAKIAGGLLASVQKGTGFVFEQEFVNKEVWLPTYVEAHVGARVLLVKGFHVTDVTRYSDYKKYHVAATSVISSPRPQ